MAVGRHRGILGIAYGRKIEVDARGNKHTVPDFDDPHPVCMDLKPIRSNRAEHKGQLTNDVQLLLMSPVMEDGTLIEDFGVWTVVEFMGRQWDVTAPPTFRPGNRRTSHWEAEVKARPGGELVGVKPA